MQHNLEIELELTLFAVRSNPNPNLQTQRIFTKFGEILALVSRTLNIKFDSLNFNRFRDITFRSFASAEV